MPAQQSRKRFLLVLPIIAIAALASFLLRDPVARGMILVASALGAGVILVYAWTVGVKVYELNAAGVRAIIGQRAATREYDWSDFVSWRTHSEGERTLLLHINPRAFRIGEIYYLRPRSRWRSEVMLWTIPEVESQVRNVLSAALPHDPKVRLNVPSLAMAAVVVIFVLAVAWALTP